MNDSSILATRPRVTDVDAAAGRAVPFHPAPSSPRATGGEPMTMIAPTRRRMLALAASTLCVLAFAPGGAVPAAHPAGNPAKPEAVLADVLRRWADVIEPMGNAPARAFSTKVTV